MIIKVKEKYICVIVPQKSGISTVTSILAYPHVNQIYNKTITRNLLEKDDLLFLLGGSIYENISFIKSNNIQIEHYIGIYRDPIERFISAYKDRVLKKNKDNFKDKSLNFVLSNLPYLIQKKTDFGNHARPQFFWLGEKKYYNKIISTHELNTIFKPIIENISDTKIPDIKQNTYIQGINVNLSDQQILFLKNFYSSDYNFIK